MSRQNPYTPTPPWISGLRQLSLDVVTCWPLMTDDQRADVLMSLFTIFLVVEEVVAEV